MSTRTSTKHKLLAWIVILAQILAMTSTGVLTALQPTPDLARNAALNLSLPPWLTEIFTGLAWCAEQLFGAPQSAQAQGVYSA